MVTEGNVVETERPAAYGRTTQALHWISALLLIGMAATGAVMTRLPEGVAQLRLYRLHVGLGLVVLGLTLGRLAWRLRDPWPSPPPGMPPWREQAFKWNHILLYVVIVVMLASGVAMLLSSGFGLWPGTVSPEGIQNVPPKNAHVVASKVFMALFVMHVAGVGLYQLKKGDTFSRMGLTWFKR
ncbi:MAG: cytochrome b/b6 domain-containing protein [Acidobacteriota bacterium]